MSSIPIKPPPARPPAETLEEKFHRLADAWHKAVAIHSSTTIRNNHPAYQEIVALGPGVIPLLLRDMEQNETHWFHALRKITGANPIPESAAGNIPLMVEAWLRWAKDNGYRVRPSTVSPSAAPVPSDTTASPGPLAMSTIGGGPFRRPIESSGRLASRGPKPSPPSATPLPLSYVVCDSEQLEPGFEKIALFANSIGFLCTPLANCPTAAGPAS